MTNKMMASEPLATWINSNYEKMQTKTAEQREQEKREAEAAIKVAKEVMALQNEADAWKGATLFLAASLMGVAMIIYTMWKFGLIVR